MSRLEQLVLLLVLPGVFSRLPGMGSLRTSGVLFLSKAPCFFPPLTVGFGHLPCVPAQGALWEVAAMPLTVRRDTGWTRLSGFM